MYSTGILKENMLQIDQGLETSNRRARTETKPAFALAQDCDSKHEDIVEV